MQKKNISRISRLKLISVLMVSAGVISLLSMPNKLNDPVSSNEVSSDQIVATEVDKVNDNNETTAADKQREQESKAAFIQAYRVFIFYEV